MSKELSWKPKAVGRRYCAPACGRGCTKSEYNKTVALYKRLAKRLGDGWRSEIWENLGWHGNIISPCGRIKISQRRGIIGKASYDSYFGDPGDIGARWTASGSTLEKAIEAVTLVAKQDLAKIGAILRNLPSITKKGRKKS